MPKIDFSSKNALVIDSSSLMRTTTITMLTTLGFRRVKGSNTSKRALELVEQGNYDLVLLGYSDLERLSGLQILEEARFKGLIKPTACWGFMTNDNSSEVVLHAMQCRPDFLISKPFSIGQLLSRLQSVLLQKQLVKPINQALDSGNLSRALEFCDFAIEKNISTIAVQQIKADLLLQTQHYAEALELLNELAGTASNNSIDLKVCEALIGTGEKDDALSKLENLISSSPLLIKAYDLKAQLHEDKGQIEKSANVLFQAMSLSSLGISRNLKLGKLALTTGKLDMAENAYKRTIQLNNGSCFRTPEPYFGLANIKREILKSSEDSREAEQQIKAILSEAQNSFPDNPELKVQVALFNSQLQQDLNNSADAQQYLEQAQKIILDNNITENLEQLKNSALMKLPDRLTKKDQLAANQPSIENQPEMSNKVNLQGIKQYLANNRAKAVKYFTMSLELNSENGSALLNLAQIYLES
ncbi:MAG: response regulator, partial [Oceanospirillaceae bacterium]